MKKTLLISFGLLFLISTVNAQVGDNPESKKWGHRNRAVPTVLSHRSQSYGFRPPERSRHWIANEKVI